MEQLPSQPLPKPISQESNQVTPKINDSLSPKIPIRLYILIILLLMVSISSVVLFLFVFDNECGYVVPLPGQNIQDETCVCLGFKARSPFWIPIPTDGLGHVWCYGIKK